MAEIDKEKLYPNWERTRKLQEDITRKALDLGEDMNITTNQGVSGKVLLGLGLGGTSIAGIAAVAIAYILSGQPGPAPSAAQNADFTIEHFDQDGELIYVPATK